MSRKGLREGRPKISQTWRIPDLFVFWLMKLKLSEVQQLMPRISPLGSCFRWILCFQCRQNLWIYLDFCGYMFYYFIPFGFLSRSILPPLGILIVIVTILRNQDKKVAFIRVDEDVQQKRSSKFMNTCNNMNITVQTTDGDASSLNDKIQISNNILADIKRSLLLELSHNK